MSVKAAARQSAGPPTLSDNDGPGNGSRGQPLGNTVTGVSRNLARGFECPGPPLLPNPLRSHPKTHLEDSRPRRIRRRIVVVFVPLSFARGLLHSAWHHLRDGHLSSSCCLQHFGPGRGAPWVMAALLARVPCGDRATLLLTLGGAWQGRRSARAKKKPQM